VGESRGNAAGKGGHVGLSAGGLNADEGLNHAQHRTEQTQKRAKVSDDVEVLDAAEGLGRLLGHGCFQRFFHGSD